MRQNGDPPSALDEREVDLAAGQPDEHVHDEHVAERKEHEGQAAEAHEVPPEPLAARCLRKRPRRARRIRVDRSRPADGGHRLSPMA